MSEIKRTVYAGTFDIFTNGHNEILMRALEIFNEVTVLVAVAPNKKTFFSADERVEMLEKIFANDSRVTIDRWDGLLAEYAKKNKISSIIRGLRPTGDFEYEFQMASMNKKLYPSVETVFLMASGFYCVSSALIREIWGHGGDVTEFVPSTVLEYLNNRKK